MPINIIVVIFWYTYSKYILAPLKPSRGARLKPQMPKSLFDNNINVEYNFAMTFSVHSWVKDEWENRFYGLLHESCIMHNSKKM